MCGEHFVVGATYTLEEKHERSAASHAHYFASLNEGWLNLPEDTAERFPTPEHLRKFALIRTGHYDERSIQCGSPEEALRLAAFIEPMDEFTIVVVDHAMVTVYTSKSQSIRAMDKKTFQQSKTDVLEYIGTLIGAEIK
jgi:hypothetical protein